MNSQLNISPLQMVKIAKIKWRMLLRGWRWFLFDEDNLASFVKLICYWMSISSKDQR